MILVFIWKMKGSGLVIKMLKENVNRLGLPDCKLGTYKTTDMFCAGINRLMKQK